MVPIVHLLVSQAIAISAGLRINPLQLRHAEPLIPLELRILDHSPQPLTH